MQHPGGSDDHRDAADLLETIRRNIGRAYARKTGRPLSEVLAMMAKETWFTASGAVEYGLADVVIGADGKPQARTRGRSLAACQRELDKIAAFLV